MAATGADPRPPRDPAPGAAPRVSIVVPAYNRPDQLAQCLGALAGAAADDSAEVIVVDDASPEDLSRAARQAGARLVRLAENRGPAGARNHGARLAAGDILFFVDADVVVRPDAVARVVRFLDEHPDVSAVFGSYDAAPRATGMVSQYRNLLHHFVHQEGQAEASTFWAGCGAIRRRAFAESGGFDEGRYPRPSIEDIELGYRLRQAGHRIALDKGLQATHLKRWTLRSIVWTDVTCRAIPWARLIFERGALPNDLNVRADQRLSVGLTGLAGLAAVLSLIRGELALAAAAAAAVVVIVNRRLFGFLRRERGGPFAAACVPLHLLYYAYSGFGYGYAWLTWRMRGAPRGAAGGGSGLA
jgi:cellulose synthase/poly-beta-1,6-N-acetylglucosamine synthase-like glycosyltransferase